MSLKQRTIDEIKHILEQTQLSARAGKYEAMEKAGWFQRVGRAKLLALLHDLQKPKEHR